MRNAQGDALQVVEDPLSSCYQAEGVLRDREEWKQVPVQSGRQISSKPTLPSQVPLYSRFESLALEGQENKHVDEGPSRGLSRVS